MMHERRHACRRAEAHRAAAWSFRRLVRAKASSVAVGAHAGSVTPSTVERRSEYGANCRAWVLHPRPHCSGTRIGQTSDSSSCECIGTSCWPGCRHLVAKSRSSSPGQQLPLAVGTDCSGPKDRFGLLGLHCDWCMMGPNLQQRYSTCSESVLKLKEWLAAT